MSIDPDELALLANMAYGESYYKDNNFEEMAGIASVLLRQRDARGYSSMQAFTAAEPSYSFVVADGNQRFNSIKKLREQHIQQKLADLAVRLQACDDALEAARPGSSKTVADTASQLRKTGETLRAQKIVYDGYAMAYRAARNAMDGGTDYSNGAYFWDGWDIKYNYSRHFKVRQGIKIMATDHNVFSIQDHLVTVIKYKVRIETRGGISNKTRTEIGRYDHVYESTAAKGGTIFWKYNPEYVSLEHAKEYK